MKIKLFKIQFSEFIPEELKEGVIYISMGFATAAHKCACGCGQEVITPFSPTDWKLTYDGDSISLSPSIGNWSYPCRSHYFIRNSRVAWASDMSPKAIELGRVHDRKIKATHYSQEESEAPTDIRKDADLASGTGGFLDAIARFFGFK